jgi:hypothetical protein
MLIRKSILVSIIVSALVLLSVGSLGASLIASVNEDVYIGRPILPSAVYFSFFFVSSTGTIDETTRVFDVLVDNSDSGKEFIATSMSGSNPNPKFDNFVRYLTNGSNDWLMYEMRSAIDERGCGMEGPESAWFNDAADFRFDTAPDFQGYIIEALGMRINSLYIESPGSYPYPGGIWTDVHYDLTFSIYGQPAQPVPAPATILLLGTGLIGLVGYGRRKLS